MPPQQSDRLLDLFDQSFDFRAHGSWNSVLGFVGLDLAVVTGERNPLTLMVRSIAEQSVSNHGTTASSFETPGFALSSYAAELSG